MENAGPGRPKTLPGKLTNFNTKIQDQHKAQLQAIVEVGPYGSYREMLEAWTARFLKDNPDLAAKAEAYMDIKKG